MAQRDERDPASEAHRSNGYEVVRELGHTPEAHRRTWEAIHVESGERVVLKAFGFGDSQLPWGGYHRNQIESLLALDHPRVPRYREMYRLANDRGFCLVQTMHPAAKLHTGVEWPQRVAAKVAMQLLELLVYLDDRIVPPVVHRDLAPQNILLSPADPSEEVDVRVVDFLLVRDELGALQPSSREAGAPGFNAPEELRGAPVDVRCDLYSLGMTVACLVTGVHEDDVLELRSGGELDRDRLAAVDPRLVEWLDSITAHDPNERPHHARTARKKLGLFIDELPDGDVPPPPARHDARDLDTTEAETDAQVSEASAGGDVEHGEGSHVDADSGPADSARDRTTAATSTTKAGREVSATAPEDELSPASDEVSATPGTTRVEGSAANDFLVAMALLFGIGLVVVLLVAVLG